MQKRFVGAQRIDFAPQVLPFLHFKGELSAQGRVFRVPNCRYLFHRRDARSFSTSTRIVNATHLTAPGQPDSTTISGDETGEVQVGIKMAMQTHYNPRRCPFACLRACTGVVKYSKYTVVYPMKSLLTFQLHEDPVLASG